jgi:hypothetical protein
VLQWNGSSWAPATVSGGGTVTTTSALTGNGSSGSPLGLAQQSATSGQVLQWNGNSWVPATDDNTTYSAGNGLAMSGTTFNLAQQGATNGQVLQWNGSSWAPASDDSTDNDWSGAGTGALTLGNSGDKVGIGTTSPSAKFQLEGGNADLVDAELTTLTTGGDTLVSITDTNSVGQVQTYAPNNSTNVAIGSVGGSPGALDHGLVAVADASGAGKGILFAQPMNGGAGELNLLDANGDQLASMSALGTAGQNGQITLFDDGGLGRAQLLSSANAGGAGQLTLLHANGNTGMLLGDAFNDNTQNAAQFVMLDSTGATKLFTGTAQSPAGGFAFANYINASNNRGVYIGTSNANNNEGAVALYDSSGAYHGGLIFNNSNQLQTVADVKNFRMQHPTQSDKAIWYASLEGPEAAAYDRGTAQLQNGTAVIELPDHFQHVASQQNLTVHLTPLSAQSQGLAAVEKGTDRIVVRELRNGQGNYKFDWEVKAVRKGFQDYQVVREQKRYAPAPPRPQQPHSLQQ